MRIFLLMTTFLISFQIYGQNDKVVSWINDNAIKIEDANPDTKLSIFNDNIPHKFAEAKIFGFGEASHHGKEFFDIKAKFFKYLVETHNVKVFIIEDSYPSEAGINEWISGGEGNVETIAENFSIAPWYCKEVVNLLKWMRNYNLTKTKDQQIRYYGMDIQNVENINQEIRDLVKNHNIPVSEELLLIVDKCAEKNIEYNESTDWADIQIPKLNEIEGILLDFRKGIKDKNIDDFNSAIRALNYLKKYTYYVQNNYFQDRDLKMYENVKWIIENKSKNGKAFIWAHNEHINNKGFGNYSRRNIYNLGRYLKEHYENDYYSVGFDFGKGTLGGYIFNKDERTKWKTYQLDKPFHNTYAETLIEGKENIYFIDILKASKTIPNNFFNKKNKQLFLGGPGYNPEQYQLFNKKFSEMYDGFIFVKSITIPNYKLSTE
ncbi:MAG: erythromycin esterase family protein [Aequorivita sp.]